MTGETTPANATGTQDPKSLEEKILQAARAERQQFPEDVRARLGVMRREAVALADPASEKKTLWSALLTLGRPLGMAGAAVCAVVALWIALAPSNDVAIPLITAPEIAVVEEMELLEELEFLAWLEEESQGAG